LSGTAGPCTDDCSKRRLQADIFFHKLGARSPSGCCLENQGRRRRGELVFTPGKQLASQPAIQPGRIDHSVCPSYEVMAQSKTRSGGSNGETLALTTDHCGSIRSANNNQDGVLNRMQWLGGDMLDRPLLRSGVY